MLDKINKSQLLMFAKYLGKKFKFKLLISYIYETTQVIKDATFDK